MPLSTHDVFVCQIRDPHRQPDQVQWPSLRMQWLGDHTLAGFKLASRP